jgi:hypothetical protein
MQPWGPVLKQVTHLALQTIGLQRLPDNVKLGRHVKQVVGAPVQVIHGGVQGKQEAPEM